MKLNLKAFGNRTVPSKLEAEGGITNVSLNNALYLLTKFGYPLEIHLVEEPDEWYVNMVWKNKVHQFSGFSWGYGGEGPHGLMTLFTALELNNEAAEVPDGNFKGKWISETSIGKVTIILGDTSKLEKKQNLTIGTKTL